MLFYFSALWLVESLLLMMINCDGCGLLQSIHLHHIRRNCSLSLYIATVHIPPHKIYYVRWNVWLAYLSTQKCPEGFFFSLPLDGRMRRLYSLHECVCVSTGEAFGQLEMQFFDFLVSLCSLFSPFLFQKNILKNDAIWVFHNDSIENRVGLLFIHQSTDKKFDFLLCGAFFLLAQNQK